MYWKRIGMSDTKINYIYNSYDCIIDYIEDEMDIDELLQKIRDFRDEMPTTKEVAQEFLNNSEELE